MAAEHRGDGLNADLDDGNQARLRTFQLYCLVDGMELAGDKLRVIFRLVAVPRLHFYEFRHFPDGTVVGIEDPIIHGVPQELKEIVAFVHAPMIDPETLWSVA